MAKKKKNENKKSVARFLPFHASLENFRDNVCDAFAEAAHGQCEDMQRIGFTEVGLAKDIGAFVSANAHKDAFCVMLSLTDGMPGMLPVIPRDLAREYDSKYYAKMQELRNKLGDDVESWSDEDVAPLQNEDRLELFVFPKEISKDYASFATVIRLVLNNKIITVKAIQHNAYAPGDERFVDGYAYRVRNDPLFINTEIYFLLKQWLFDPATAWKSTETRLIEEAFLEVAGSFMENLGPWESDDFDIPRVGFHTLIYATKSDCLNSFPASHIKSECSEIIGDYFTPGKAAAFLLSGILKDGALDLSLRGPLAYDSVVAITKQDLVKEFEKCGVIHADTISKEELHAYCHPESNANNVSEKLERVGDGFAQALGIAGAIDNENETEED